ncbi:cobalamin biosynthesis protein P47K [Eubacterium sp. AM05-23]|uniref:GTP-binding protein n=1 Tax=Eubacterium TaxID=1730 RepID=UPI000E509DB6|nr:MULTISPECIES: GTP-binding protein [Eubacterium]RHO61110.1 cobalamin biosynthesis protein P47K [Eubacterium sp. AM05-23]
MKVIILGGFLGSGKTTALLSLVKYLNVQKDPSKEVSTAILENEIGEIGVDDQILSFGDYKVSTLFSGCICCTMASDLTQCINTITQKYQPETILIEATGLAYPDRIADVISKYAPDCTMITILVLVDAERWDENIDELYGMMSRQIHAGNSVLLNKTDCINLEDQVRIIKEIKAIHPKGNVLSVNARNGISKEQWNEILGNGQET